MGRAAQTPAPPAAAPSPTPSFGGGASPQGGQLSGQINERLDRIQSAVDRNNEAITALGTQTQLQSPQNTGSTGVNDVFAGLQQQAEQEEAAAVAANAPPPEPFQLDFNLGNLGRLSK